jgi:hypothetical protein
MQIVEHNGVWIIRHGGREIAEDFETEDEAWSWADANVDDQVFDSPNHHYPPLRYREKVR